jgi:O-methyltransferase domain
MTMTPHQNAADQPVANKKAIDTIVQLSIDGFASRCLHVAADLGIADHLAETPRPVPEIAAEVGADADALIRVLRVLTTYGIFELRGELLWHTVASRMLRSDHAQPMGAVPQMFGLGSIWKIAEGLEHSVRTGRASAELMSPGGWWQHLAEHPQEAQVFGASLGSWSEVHHAGIISSYDFGRFERLVDVGGGSGTLIRAILAANPSLQGTLFDLPYATEMAPPTERLSTHAGSFLKDPLPGADAYVMMQVLHNWNDEQSVQILSAIRRAASAGATVLILESPLETGPENDPANDWVKTFDVMMLAFLAGRERTVDQYAALFGAAGLHYERTIDIGTSLKMLEATVPA